MISERCNLRLRSLRRGFVSGVALTIITLTAANSAYAAPKPKITSPTTDSATVGTAYSYQITADQVIVTWGASPLPAGLSVSTTTGLISGTPTTAGTYDITLSATNGNGTGTQNLRLTISNPTPTPIPGNAFVAFRLPDYPANATPAPTPAANNARLMLQIGATQGGLAHPFNATLEVDASDPPHTVPAWVPYNHFIGVAGDINNASDGARASWITDAPLPVRDLPGSSPPPTPYPSPPAFNTTQLTQAPPGMYMKTDPRSTRFGIFQEDSIKSGNARIIESLWPKGSPAPPPPTPPPNGYGGTIGTTFSPATVDIEHAPVRFNGNPFYPATFAINGSVDVPPGRDTATTTYADSDSVTRPADAIYPGAGTSLGSSTPYYPTSTVYRPIILNRPFRNVAELGYAFRDLPWKTLDFFSDKSADAGLLDIFTINDGAQVLDGNGNVIGMAPPSTTAGSVNLNTTQAPDLQAVFAGTILNEFDSTNTISNTGNGATAAPVLAANVVTATAATPMQNKSELLTRASLPITILPTASNDNQAVKARREVVARAVSSVAQTRVWNLVIDVVAQSGHFKPNAGSLQNDFVVEGEQHYWVHVAIDRFTGRVLDKQIEVVNE
jgi:Putative Ig domain